MYRLRRVGVKLHRMDKLLLRPVEAAEAIGIGRSKVYELLASGELPSIRIGSSIRVPVEQLREWIQRKATGEHRG
jgi:excisionase family DNA binding protein